MRSDIKNSKQKFGSFESNLIKKSFLQIVTSREFCTKTKDLSKIFEKKSKTYHVKSFWQFNQTRRNLQQKR